MSYFYSAPGAKNANNNGLFRAGNHGNCFTLLDFFGGETFPRKIRVLIYRQEKIYIIPREARMASETALFANKLLDNQGALTKVADVVSKIGNPNSVAKMVINLLSRTPEVSQPTLKELESIHVHVDRMWNEARKEFAVAHREFGELLRLTELLYESLSSLHHKYVRLLEIRQDFGQDWNRMKAKMMELLEGNSREQIIRSITSIGELILGNAVVFPGSFREFVCREEKEMVGRKRWGFIKSALAFYTRVLAIQYEGLVILNLTVFMDGETQCPSPDVMRCHRVIEEEEKNNPAFDFQDFFNNRKLTGCVRPTDNKQIVWFCGDEYLTWNFSNDKLCSGPRRLSYQDGWFARLPQRFHYPDAVIRRPSNKARQMIFFKKDEFLMWDFTHNQIECGPYKMSDKWFARMPFCRSGVDAAVIRPSNHGHIIFFKGDEFCVWDFTPDSLIDRGKMTDKWFSGLPIYMKLGVDSVLLRPTKQNQEIMFFKGNKIALWDFTPDKLLQEKYLHDMWFEGLSKEWSLE